MSGLRIDSDNAGGPEGRLAGGEQAQKLSP
jgi:hypothetical protein